ATPFEEESPFDRTMPPFSEAEATGDAEPMARAHDESPFEEPVESFTSATMEIEAASGFQVETPLVAEVPTVFEIAEPEVAPVEPDVTETLTMADLYVRQGLIDDARTIYAHILARDPDNAEVRAKLDAITPRVNAKVDRLERWLAKVKRSAEVPRV
ncbi:MAG TPA: tetratricopeptide repeat protein, partial [Thermoanaerobaculia bacterium]|nr:tetratricopeptide repeat protein [Thermoanaerobaculia bacterium]